MPFDIVSYVMGLNAGKGSGGKDDDRQFTFYDKSFTATETQMTIEHNLGKIPDVVIVNIHDTPEKGAMFFAVGCSKAMIDKTNGLYSMVLFTALQGGAFYASDDNGIENPADWPTYASLGGIREATANSFVIGTIKDDGSGLQVGKLYDVRIISGIT